MQKLCSVHLYLGCLFAPVLLFMAISGIWQTCGYANSKILALLSTIHTSRNLKLGGLANSFTRDFVLIASVAFIVTIILGVVMALKFGRSRKATIGSLILGVLIPLALVSIRFVR